MLVLTVTLIILVGTSLIIRNRKLYCGVSFFVLLLLTALRSKAVGSDGLVYARYFEQLKAMSFDDIASFFTKEPIFYWVTKYLQNWGVDLQVWYGIIGAVFLGATICIIYKYSKQPVISILVFFSLSYFTFSLTGLRQTVAMGGILLSFLFLEQKKYLRFLVLILLSSLFHNTAVIFVLVLFFKDKEISIKSYSIGLILSLGGALFFRNQIYNAIYYLLDTNERLSSYSGNSYGLTWSGFIIQFCIFIFVLVANSEKTKLKNYLLNICYLGLIFQAFSWFIAEFFRISMYFSIFNIVLIANTYVSNRFNEESKKIVKSLVVLALFAYFLKSNMSYQYLFYWQ